MSLVERSRSRNSFTTDSKSVCLGIEHPCGACDQILLLVGMLLLYKNAIRTSQERHYASATEPNLLMLFGENPLFLLRWGYFTTDGRSVSQSVSLGIEHPCETCDQILLPVGMSKLLYDWRSVSHGIEHPCGTSDQILLPVGTSKLLYDWKSASQSWYRAPLWDLRPDITSCRNVTVWNLRSCIYEAPSLTRGPVYNLQCNHSTGLIAQNP
jgi:hypothetical protein